MKTNELKKGQRVKLRNGWEATLEDNMRGNRRMATVEGYHTEMGSVYSHDIVYALETDDIGQVVHHEIEHTKAQLKLREQVKVMGF